MHARVFAALTAVALVELSCLSFGAPVRPREPGAQAGGSSVPSFTIAVLRRDGVIIPILSYGLRGWVNPWPAPGRRPDVPIRVEDTPGGWWAEKRPIAEWTAWPMRGERRTIRVKSPTNLMVECQPQIGLETDYQSAERREPSRMQPYPKDGLATAGDVAIEPVRVLDDKSPEWAAIYMAVGTEVTATENPLWKDEGSSYRAVLTPAVRAATGFTLEVLFASPDVKPGGTVLYFEGVKRYAPRTGLPPGGLLTYAVGYARIRPSAPPQIKVTAALSTRQRQGLVYSLVLGSFRMDGRLFWVVQRSTWGYERFDLVEIRDDEILTIFKTSGGVCEG